MLRFAPRLGRRFTRDTRGATAVEFALVAFPLLALLFGILELALVYLVATTLENATYVAGRTIRTGELRESAGNLATMKTTICSNLAWLGANCMSNLYIDVDTLTAFNNPGMKAPMKNGDIDPSQMKWEPGVQGNIVLVRSYYRWSMVTPFLRGGIQKTGNGEAIITAAATFRNEP